ncbi:MAG TPA: molybdopterin biosynthesis protein, partial [Rhodobacterales bacterium]|nr:molybdopterin biosynthesis protein [Rhodobacterales bacterium]
MTLFLIALVAIWGLGTWAGLPMRLRWGLTALLFAAILLVHALLPPNHPLPALFGGTFAGWATLAGAAVIVG